MPKIVTFSSSLPDCPFPGPRGPRLSFEVKNYPPKIELKAVYEDGHQRTFYTRNVPGAESVAVEGVWDPGVEPGITEYLLVAGLVQKRLRFRIPRVIRFEIAANGTSRVRERHGDNVVVEFTFPVRQVAYATNFRALGRGWWYAPGIGRRRRVEGQVFVPLSLDAGGRNLHGAIATPVKDYPGFFALALDFEVAADSDQHMGCPAGTLRRHIQVPRLVP